MCTTNLGFIDQWTGMLCLSIWWLQPSDEATDPQTTKSYKTKGGSTVHQAWFSAAAILTLPNFNYQRFCCRMQSMWNWIGCKNPSKVDEYFHCPITYVDQIYARVKVRTNLEVFLTTRCFNDDVELDTDTSTEKSTYSLLITSYW